MKIFEKQKIFLLLVLFVFLWGFLLRVVEVANGNYLFGFDQGRDYLAAYNIVENNKLTLIGAEVGAGSAGLSGLFHGPGYYYLIALMYYLFQSDPYGGLVLMFVFGIGTLLAVYMTTKRMFGTLGGFISLVLVSISPLIVSQSRFLWNHHPSSFFIVFCLYFVYKMKDRPRLYAPLAIFTAGIIYHFELAIAVPMMIGVFLSIVFIYRIKDIRTYGYLAVGSIIAFLPMIIFEIRHGFTAVSGLWTYIFGAQSISRGIPVVRIADHFASYVNNARNSFAIEDGFLSERFYSFFIIAVIVLALMYAVRTKEKKISLFIYTQFLILIVSYGVLLFLNNSIWDYYLLHAHFIYMYLTACVFAWIWKNRDVNKYYMIAGVVTLVVFLSMAKGTSMRMYRNIKYDFYDYGGIEKIKGKKFVVDYVYDGALGKPFNVFVFVPPIYTYPYDYLFLTYGKKKYGYAPGNIKEGLAYLIIEKDPSKPWTYKGWLETVIKDGTTIDQTVLSSGHIVEKRLFENIRQ